MRYEIGRGTYGCVLLARPKDPKAFPRRVAIKLCRPEVPSLSCSPSSVPLILSLSFVPDTFFFSQSQAGEMSLLLKEGLALRKVDSPWVARLIEMGAIVIPQPQPHSNAPDISPCMRTVFFPHKCIPLALASASFLSLRIPLTRMLAG